MRVESAERVVPLRLLMAVPQYPFPVTGGLEKQAHALAMELVRQGHVVQAISGRIHAQQPEREVLDGVVVHRLPWPRLRFVRWLSMPWVMWCTYRKTVPDIDVVHCHVFSGFGLASILFAHALGKPILVKLPNVGAGGVPGLRAQGFGFLREWILKRADALVAMSAESVRELNAIGFDLHRVLTTPNGIDVPSRPARSAAASGLPVRLAFVGRLCEQKGVADLFAALAQIAQDQSWTLDLIGAGPLRAELQARAFAAGISSNVTFRGHVHDVQGTLLEFDALVLPSYREGNSNAILEAMAAGLPVVSTRVGGTPLLVGSVGAELLHEAGDIDALARLLRCVIGDAALRHRIGTAMRARVEECFDIRRVAATYATAYRLLAARRRTEIHTVSNPVVPRDEATLCAD